LCRSAANLLQFSFAVPPGGGRFAGEGDRASSQLFPMLLSGGGGFDQFRAELGLAFARTQAVPEHDRNQ
jgi:hypothetical protein